MLIRHFVATLASPVVIALLIGAAGCVCRALGWRRLAVGAWATAFVIGYLGTLSPVGDALLGPLEHRYPPLRLEQSLAAVGYIVVLGSRYAPRDGIPVTAALDEDGLVRIVEGIRLARRIPSARLVVSGGAPSGRVGSALGYADLARDLGIGEESLIVLSTPLDTNAEARALAARLGRAPFILVTSASHMPRAILLMERAGAHPVPAPTGQQVDRSIAWSWHDLLPTSAGLRKSEYALHEYLGLASLTLTI
jgi:uncharacterized SAM-binding protein YcdF (DUF218 family)